MNRVLILTVAVALAAGASAVTPQSVLHTTEADFTKAKFSGTGVNSYGEIRLAREVSVRMDDKAAPAVVSSVVAQGRSVFVGSGVDGKVYLVTGRKHEVFATVPGTMVTAMLAEGDSLLVGTGGDGAGLYRVSAAGQARKLWQDKDVQYVWAILPGPGKTIYVGTGPKAGVYVVTPNGKANKLHDLSKQAKNVLCLAKGPNGLLYAGTDTEGLVVEINLATRRGRVVLDADEKEISALIVDREGGVYVSTADAAKAAPEDVETPSTEKGGKTAESQPDGKAKAAPAPKAVLPRAKAERRGDAASRPARRDRRRPERAKAKDAKGRSGEIPLPDAPGNDSKETPRVARKTVRGQAPKAARGSVRPTTRKAAPRSAAPPSRPTAERSVSRRPSVTEAGSGKGNAVYYIRPDGLVETVFRRPVMILSMLRQGNFLLLGTGNGGRVYEVSLDGDRVACLADTDAKQVTALALAADGELFFGTANKGGLAVLTARMARQGTVVSDAVDVKQIVRWGSVSLVGTVPGRTGVTISTRTGNVAEPDESTWSARSPEIPFGKGFANLQSPPGRFLQYRLRFRGTGQASPTITAVRLVYQMGNLPPVLAAMKVTPGNKGPAGQLSSMAYRLVEVKAADPNGDELDYQIDVRKVGTSHWVKIDGQAGPKFAWDTRSFSDGTYELRVSVSDRPSNPPKSAQVARRISEPVVVDNTVPKVSNLKASFAQRRVMVAGTASDAASPVVKIAYAVDSQDKWVTVLPTDGICDSLAEAFTLTTDALEPGIHRIAVRVEDELGNVGFGAVTVRVDK